MASISPYDVIRAPAPMPPRHSLLKSALDLDHAGGDDSLIPPPPVHYPNAVDFSDTEPDAPEDPEAHADINVPVNDERWEGGFSFLSESCGNGVIWVPCGAHNVSATSDICLTQDYVPTVVQVQVQRSSYGYEAIDFKGRAARFLDGVQHRDMGAEFWFGTSAIAEALPNNYLVKAGFTDLGTAANSTTALADLQSYLDTTGMGGWGFIHAPKRLVDEWAANFQIFETVSDLENIKIYDIYGNQIIADPGYQNTPNGAGKWEAYATGPVYGKLGEMMLVPQDMKAALDRGTNTISYRAERFWALVWDGCQHAKVQVTVT